MIMSYLVKNCVYTVFEEFKADLMGKYVKILNMCLQFHILKLFACFDILHKFEYDYIAYLCIIYLYTISLLSL